MGWVLLRIATQEDHDRLDRTCEDFIRVYSHYAAMDAEDWIADAKDNPIPLIDIAWHVVDGVHYEGQAWLRSILKKRIRRALRHPDAEGIAFDHVGWYSA